MKKIVCLIAFVCVALLLNAQNPSTDPDWIIKDKKFNDAPISGTGNAYRFENIGPPNDSCSSLADDDVFIIFNDISFYNSRYLRQAFSSSDVSNRPNYFNYNGSHLDLYTEKEIVYMTLTEVYDDNGRPTAARKINNLSIQAEQNIINSVSDLSSLPILSANRNAVPGKDITLVINLDSLDMDQIYKVSFDQVVNQSFEPISSGENLFPSIIFGENYHLGSIEFYSPDFDQALYFRKTSNTRFLYLNFLVNTELQELCNPQGDPANNILFELSSAESPIKSTPLNSLTKPEYANLPWEDRAQLTEELRNVHDPNHIISNTICQENIVKYEIEFYNDQPTLATNIECFVKFPKSVSIKDVCLNSSSYKDENVPLFLETKNNVIVIKLAESFSCVSCQSGIPNPVSIFLDIQFQSLDLDINLAPSEAYTIFNSHTTRDTFTLNYYDRTCRHYPSSSSAHSATSTGCKRGVSDCETCIPPERQGWYKYLLMAVLALVSAAATRAILKKRRITTHTPQAPEDS